MTAALLAATAELDALRLAAAEGDATDAEIYAAYRKVWHLERAEVLARQRAPRRRKRSRAEHVRALYAYCLSRRPHLAASVRNRKPAVEVKPTRPGRP